MHKHLSLIKIIAGKIFSLEKANDGSLNGSRDSILKIEDQITPLSSRIVEMRDIFEKLLEENFELVNFINLKELLDEANQLILSISQGNQSPLLAATNKETHLNSMDSEIKDGKNDNEKEDREKLDENEKKEDEKKEKKNVDIPQAQEQHEKSDISFLHPSNLFGKSDHEEVKEITKRD